MGLYDMYDIPIAKHLAGYNTDESIMPAVKNILSTPMVEDTNMAALTGMDLPNIMSNAFNIRNNALSTYGNLLKEDTSNYMKGPTAIKALSEAKENAGKYDPGVQADVERGKQFGKSSGEYDAWDSMAVAYDKVQAPKDLQDMGIRTVGDAVRQWGPDWKSVASSIIGGNARIKAAGIGAGGVVSAAGINANGLRTGAALTAQIQAENDRLNGLDNEYKNLIQMKNGLSTSAMMSGTRGDEARAQLVNINKQISANRLAAQGSQDALRDISSTVGGVVNKRLGRTRPFKIQEETDIPTAGTSVQTSRGVGKYTGRIGPNGHPTIMLGGKEFEYKSK